MESRLPQRIADGLSTRSACLLDRLAEVTDGTSLAGSRTFGTSVGDQLFHQPCSLRIPLTHEFLRSRESSVRVTIPGCVLVERHVE